MQTAAAVLWVAMAAVGLGHLQQVLQLVVVGHAAAV
jgi:hypothetical protein